MAQAPVCNVQGVVREPDQALAKLQPIPRATDLPSAIKAIQALTNNFNLAGNYVEQRQLRTYTTNRVFNPDDTTQWVDVLQITGLVFLDRVTGKTIVWRQ
jgi:hypothetical protein